jgi:hypothetical protein
MSLNCQTMHTCSGNILNATLCEEFGLQLKATTSAWRQQQQQQWRCAAGLGPLKACRPQVPTHGVMGDIAGIY